MPSFKKMDKSNEKILTPSLEFHGAVFLQV